MTNLRPESSLREVLPEVRVLLKVHAIAAAWELGGLIDLCRGAAAKLERRHSEPRPNAPPPEAGQKTSVVRLRCAHFRKMAGEFIQRLRPAVQMAVPRLGGAEIRLLKDHPRLSALVL